MKQLDYLTRQKLVKKRLESEDIDILIIPPSVNFYYLFKGYLQLSERLICGIKDKTENAVLIAPSFETENMQVQTTFDDVQTWNDNVEIMRDFALRRNDFQWDHMIQG